VTKNPKLLIAVVALLAAVGAYWMLVLSPKREQISKLDGEISTAQTDLQQAQATLGTYQKAQAAYKSNYSTVVRLGKAMPADDDVRSLVVQLDAAAKRTGVDFGSISVGGGSSSSAPTQTDQKAGPPGTVSVANGGYTAMPFTFQFDGRFRNLRTFLASLEHFVTVSNDNIEVTGRLLRLESLSLQAGEEGFPQIAAQIGATSYLLPTSEDASATTQAAATTAQASATATPGSGTTTPPTTTATTTGAIR
jgi:type II secretory pathway pseudopilin PulG